jgi:hypothetical protein
LKEFLIVVAVALAAIYVGFHELIFYTDIFAVGEELSQMDVDQLSRRSDMSPEEILGRLKTKAAQLKFDVLHVEVTRSAQQPIPLANGGPSIASLHDYAVHAVLSREVLFHHPQQGHVDRSWGSRCANGVGGGEDDQKVLTAVDPPP